MYNIVYSGDAQNAIKAAKDFRAEQDKGRKGVDASVKSYGKADVAARRFLRGAETAQDRYNRRLAQGSELVRKGVIDQKQAEQAAARYRQQLLRVGQANRSAFGATAARDIKAYATGLFGVSQAISGVSGLLRQAAAERERLEQQVRQSRVGLAELSQLAAAGATTPGGREKAFAAAVAEARAFRSAGAADSVDAAAREVFFLRSAGLDRGDRDFARDVKASGSISDLAGLAQAFDALRTNLGAKEVGSFEDFLDKAIAASSFAPAQAPEIPQAAARSAGSARALGLSVDSLNAATAFLAKSTGSATEGGTQLAAFLKGIEKDGLAADPTLKGLSLVELVREINSRGLDRGGLADLVGDRQEAITGFRTLAAVLPEFENAVRAIRQADADNLARQTISLPDTDEQLRVGRLADRAKARGDVVGQSTVGVTGNVIEAARQELVAVRRARGDQLAEVKNLFESMNVNFSLLLGEQRVLIEAALRRSEDLTPETVAALRDELAKLNGTSEKIATNTSPSQPSARRER